MLYSHESSPDIKLGNIDIGIEDLGVNIEIEVVTDQLQMV